MMSQRIRKRCLSPRCRGAQPAMGSRICCRNRIRKEYEAILKKNCKENEFALKKFQAQFEMKLAQKNETHQKELNTAVMNGKNVLNALMVKHEKELEAMREHFERIQEENDRKRDLIIVEKEEQLKKASKDVKE